MIEQSTTEKMKAEMVSAASAYAEKSGQKLWSIGKEAMGDSKFFNRLEERPGFNVTSYDRLMTWLRERDSEVMQ